MSPLVFLVKEGDGDRPLSAAQKQVSAAHARQRGPGERVNVELNNWRVLPRIRSCPTRASKLVAAVPNPPDRSA